MSTLGHEATSLVARRTLNWSRNWVTSVISLPTFGGQELAIALRIAAEDRRVVLRSLRAADADVAKSRAALRVRRAQREAGRKRICWHGNHQNQTRLAI